MSQASGARSGEIWAVGGGKGGTGKSLLTGLLGLSLARSGRKVILIDMDLGGANLHASFGLYRPDRSLTRFFEGESTLADLALPTAVPNVSIIAGDIQSLASDHVRFANKLKLFRQMGRLEAEIVIADLGAGLHPHTLDTFLVADKMIAVLVPELTAVESLYHFVRNALFRRLKKAFRDRGYGDRVAETWDRRGELGLRGLSDLLDHLRGSDAEIAGILNAELACFRIHLVLNMVRTPRDLLLGASVKSILTKFFGVPVQLSGAVGYNPEAWRSARERSAFLAEISLNGSARDIRLLAENLLRETEIAPPGEA